MPAWLAPVAAAGITALGSAFNAVSGNKDRQRQREEERRQFDQTMAQRRAEQEAQQAMDRAKYMDERAGAAANVQDRLNYAPMADRAAALMAARLGVSPEPWQPRDYTRGTMPGRGQARGGIDSVLQAERAANAAYRPGTGGINTDQLRAMMDRLKDDTAVPMYRNPGTSSVSAGGYTGGGGGGGGGARTPEEEAMMSRFTPYLI